MVDNNNSESKNVLTIKDINKELDKNINQIKSENKELKEGFFKLKENYINLKKKVSISNMSINETEIDKIKEELNSKEKANKLLNERVKLIQSELNILNNKIERIETKLCDKIKNDKNFQDSNTPELIKYFKEMVFVNIEKRDDAKKKNRIFLEKLLILGEKIKAFKYKRISSDLDNKISSTSLTFN